MTIIGDYIGLSIGFFVFFLGIGIGWKWKINRSYLKGFEEDYGPISVKMQTSRGNYLIIIETTAKTEGWKFVIDPTNRAFEAKLKAHLQLRDEVYKSTYQKDTLTFSFKDLDLAKKALRYTNRECKGEKDSFNASFFLPRTYFRNLLTVFLSLSILYIAMQGFEPKPEYLLLISLSSAFYLGKTSLKDERAFDTVGVKIHSMKNFSDSVTSKPFKFITMAFLFLMIMGIAFFFPSQVRDQYLIISFSLASFVVGLGAYELYTDGSKKRETIAAPEPSKLRNMAWIRTGIGIITIFFLLIFFAISMDVTTEEMHALSDILNFPIGEFTGNLTEALRELDAIATYDTLSQAYYYFYLFSTVFLTAYYGTAEK